MRWHFNNPIRWFDHSIRPRAWLALALGACLFSPGARASGWDVSLSASSDKVRRGFSESDGRAVWALDLGRSWDSGWSLFAGAGGPTYPSSGGGAELSLNLSRAWQLDDDWVAQASASRYEVLGEPRARAYRYKEAQFNLAWRGRWTLALAASPDTSRFASSGGLRTGRVWSLDVGTRQRLWNRLTLDLGAGYVDQSGLQSPGYAYGSIGLSWGVGPLQVFVSFIDSQSRRVQAAGAGDAGPRRVASAVWSF